METKNTQIDFTNSPASSLDCNPGILTPLVVAAIDAAKLCAVHRSQWFKMVSASKTPAPVRLSPRKPVWLISELKAWLEAGAPPRDQWEKMKRGKS